MKESMKLAFVRTVPVLFGYLFLGMAFGLLMQKAGYPALWALASSVFVYAGSMQFLLVGLLGGGAGLLSVALLTLAVNSRHMLYGLSFIERFRSMGRARPYMIFSLTDETYSVLCAAQMPKTPEGNRALFLIALLDQLYWVAGTAIGALAGQLLAFHYEGIDFAMTALFIVIFVEQCLRKASRLPAVIGLACGAVCLLVFGADGFILPALALCVGLLIALRPLIEKRGTNEAKEAGAQ